MVDGVSTLLAMAHSHLSAGIWRDERGVNLLDGGAPFYDTYECADGRYVAVGALEPQFFAALVETLGLTGPPQQYDVARWPDLRATLAATFKTKPRDEWAALFEDVDACVAPVLSLGEARTHPHLAARQTLLDRDGVVQPAPAPRFDRTPGAVQGPPRPPGADTTGALHDWGFDDTEIERLRTDGVIGGSGE
jgi:alpha-methylacyl-CoA racemase